MKLKNTYLSLCEYFASAPVQTKLASINLPAIAHVDLWKEQSDNEKTELAYLLPAVFISFDNTHYDNIGIGHRYDALSDITFYLESHTWDSTAQGAENQPSALQPLELFDALLEILLDYKGAKGERLIIKRTQYSQSRYNNPVSELEFEMQAYNCA
jgi:hypothetical protein